MKEGWEYKKIKDIGSVIAGTTPNTNVAEYWNGNLCWISPAELDGSHYLYDSRKKITEAAVKAKSLRLLPEGTVILSSRAPIGKVVINKIPTYCNQGFKCVVCGKEVYNEFLYWWFWGKTEYLNSLGTGATFKEISKKVVEEILIPVPSLSEQQRIVDYLDSAFTKIDAMKANAEKALNEAKALFQASLKEMLEPKEGWEEKTIGEVSLLKSGNSDANKSKPGSLPYVKVGDMNLKGNETYITVSSTYVDRQDNIKNIFPIGTLIFPKRGGAIFTNKKRLTEIEICCDLNVMGVIPNKNSVLPLFLYYFFNTIDFNIFKDEGASIPQINNKNIAPIMICLPSLSEQQRIVATLDSLKSKVDRLQANFEKISQECDALKQALLREVFEG